MDDVAECAEPDDQELRQRYRSYLKT
jgi:hypothetical protein